MELINKHTTTCHSATLDMSILGTFLQISYYFHMSVGRHRGASLDKALNIGRSLLYEQCEGQKNDR